MYIYRERDIHTNIHTHIHVLYRTLLYMMLMITYSNFILYRIIHYSLL